MIRFSTETFVGRSRQLTYRKRLFLLMLLDSLIVSTALFAAAWIGYPAYTAVNMPALAISAIALLIFHPLYAIIYKFYQKVWAYASVGELLAIVKAVTLSVVSTSTVQFVDNDICIYRRALIVTWLIHISLIGGSGFVWRVFRDHYIASDKGKTRTLIVGAGSAGTMIARQLQNNNHGDDELLPVAFVDDDVAKLQMEIYGVPVLGQIKDIPTLVENHHIERVVIAIPSLRNGQLNNIVSKCNETKAKVQMIPKIEDLMTGKVSVKH